MRQDKSHYAKNNKNYECKYSFSLKLQKSIYNIIGIYRLDNLYVIRVTKIIGTYI